MSNSAKQYGSKERSIQQENPKDPSMVYLKPKVRSIARSESRIFSAISLCYRSYILFETLQWLSCISHFFDFLILSMSIMHCFLIIRHLTNRHNWTFLNPFESLSKPRIFSRVKTMAGPMALDCSWNTLRAIQQGILVLVALLFCWRWRFSFR